MTKEIIIRKITSRKFILTVIFLIFGILCVTGVIPIDLQEQWKLLFSMAAGLIAYIVGESATDISSILKQNKEDIENAETDNDE